MYDSFAAPDRCKNNCIIVYFKPTLQIDSLSNYCGNGLSACCRSTFNIRTGKDCAITQEGIVWMLSHIDRLVQERRNSSALAM